MNIGTYWLLRDNIIVKKRRISFQRDGKRIGTGKYTILVRV
jgi:hypothetical protein